MPDITLPIKKKGRKGGSMGDKEGSVSEMNSGLVDLSRTDNVDSSGPVPKSNRNLIFNG